MSQYYWEGIGDSRWTFTVFVKSEGDDVGRVEMAYMIMSVGDCFASCPITSANWATVLLDPISCSINLKA